SFVIDGTLPGLTVDRIDPVVETARYIEKIMASRGHTLDADAQALLREDLASPCTEEVAVFHAFSRIVAEARDSFVIVDTAPTGHTLLLLDATGAYHRQMTHQMSGMAGRMVTPLMRLQDPAYTKIILVTLPEATPVSEAASLQHDLDRAGIRPFAWVVNRSMAASGTRDPILASRVVGEKAQIARVRRRYSNRVFALAYQPKAPVGLAALRRITDPAP
ncbi:MAG: arsenical pump-driving ATPase, partial [Niveispirillum sp.]|nr:arsenical pump-driving ATPase [Niveispirillum sp.]